MALSGRLQQHTNLTQNLRLYNPKEANPEQYTKSYSMLKDFIEQSLDSYRVCEAVLRVLVCSLWEPLNDFSLPSSERDPDVAFSAARNACGAVSCVRAHLSGASLERLRPRWYAACGSRVARYASPLTPPYPRFTDRFPLHFHRSHTSFFFIFYFSSLVLSHSSVKTRLEPRSPSSSFGSASWMLFVLTSPLLREFLATRIVSLFFLSLVQPTISCRSSGWSMASSIRTTSRRLSPS